MARRFHSELPPDEVWYRLNILLQDHGVWGPKGERVHGELTSWGCYLWIDGMRVPLHLWTEEENAGCAVCCRYAPHRRTLLEILALMALPLGATVLEGLGGPALRLVLTVLAVAVILGGFLALILLLLPGIASWGKRASLLAWVEHYLLPREPEGVLLPPLEEQRACWTGLEKADVPSRLAYTFRSGMPPEELSAALETWIAGRNAREEGRAVTKVKWSGHRLTLSRTEIEKLDGVRRTTAGSTGHAVGYSVGYQVCGKEWSFRQPFQGTVKPDGAGGSILQGRFRSFPTEGILQFLREHFEEIEEI